MSFKREGDDTDLLKYLQHKRVSDILGDNIPDDEARLLSNGRLSCIVCRKRPIFDTMQMLSIHRKGKKHMIELNGYLQHKRDLESRKQNKNNKLLFGVRKKNEDVSPLLVVAANNTNKLSPTRKPSLTFPSETNRTEEDTVTAAGLVSGNSQVRRYLKDIIKKQPFAKTVSKLRENYNVSTDDKMEEDVEVHQTSSGKVITEEELKKLESGWIRDGKGGWVKDPDVEFDTDEEL